MNQVIAWHRLPTLLGLGNLWVFRNDLRAHNLHDTSQLDTENPTELEGEKVGPFRTSDGSYTDPKVPAMGASGTRFGRNSPLDRSWPDDANLMTPNPREVSRKLMTRDTFTPVPGLNLHAASWIQFMNHDWFNHQARPKEEGAEAFEIPLGGDDDWPGDGRKVPMLLRTTPRDPTRPEGSAGPPTFISTETHWWDGSQIYGSNRERQQQVRAGEGGHVHVQPDGFLREDPATPGIDLTGFNDNWWVGLAMLHGLFHKEHNHICDGLAKQYPEHAGDDEWLFQIARLVNSALTAKIHTVEWTPAILGHPALQVAMDGNWWGVLREWGFRKFGRRWSDSEVLTGIPGTPADHHTAPYYLTEEFVAVYRLHNLIPDEVTFHKHDDGSVLGTRDFTSLQGSETRAAMAAHGGLDDLFYSFGIEHPGAITMHNFPRSLQHFKRINGDEFDLAAVDLLRDRERGVPRYNDMREILRMPRVASFEDMTDNPEWARQLEEVYGDVDKVDLQIGMLAEPFPKGFGFSDTAFRIFILMASRRLKSDRFFTEDYRPEIYTPWGMEHVENTTMADVVVRHHPEVAAYINLDNFFFPWQAAK